MLPKRNALFYRVKRDHITINYYINIQLLLSNDVVYK